MKPQKPSHLTHSQALRDRKIARLTTTLQRTFESVERIQGKIARLLTRCQS